MMASGRTIRSIITGEKRSIPPGVEIRPAFSSDYCAVRKLILEVDWLGGWDYMSGDWDVCVADPSRVIVLAYITQTEEVAAICCLRVVDHGRVWYGYGARSSPRYQQQNLFWACSAERTRMAMERFGPPEKLLGSAENVERMLRLKKEGKLDVQIAYMGNFMFPCRLTEMSTLRPLLDQFLRMTALPDPHQLLLQKIDGPTQLQNLLKHRSTREHLFPLGHLMLSYEVYEVNAQMPYDMSFTERKVLVSPILQDPSTDCDVSKSSDSSFKSLESSKPLPSSTKHSSSSSSPSYSNNSSILNYSSSFSSSSPLLPSSSPLVSSISIGTPFPCITGTGYNIELNGGDLALPLLLAHCKAHLADLEVYHKRYGGNVSLFIYAPETCDLKPLDQLFHHTLGLDDQGFGVKPNIAVIHPKPKVNKLPSTL